VVAPQKGTRASVAGGPLVRAQWSFLPPLFAEAEIAGVVHGTNDRFFFLPDTTVYTIPLFGVDAAAGLGVHFL
jgi:hypothetical protein